MCDAAHVVRQRLEDAGMAAYLKTTGGKGLHVVTPLVPETSWEDTKAFAAQIARSIASDSPIRYTATSGKAKRRGKVFIDYLRNARGATSVAPYSTRARPGAPVATPLRWDELSRLQASDRYDVASVLRRLASLSVDPWDGYADAASPLPYAPK